jgi:hypothetical protein
MKNKKTQNQKLILSSVGLPVAPQGGIFAALGLVSFNLKSNV